MERRPSESDFRSDFVSRPIFSGAGRLFTGLERGQKPVSSSTSISCFQPRHCETGSVCRSPHSGFRCSRWWAEEPEASSDLGGDATPVFRTRLAVSYFLFRSETAAAVFPSYARRSVHQNDCRSFCGGIDPQPKRRLNPVCPKDSDR